MSVQFFACDGHRLVVRPDEEPSLLCEIMKELFSNRSRENLREVLVRDDIRSFCVEHNKWLQLVVDLRMAAQSSG